MYKMHYTTEDLGNPECYQRKRFESYIINLQEIGAQIATNLKVFIYLCDDKSSSLHV